MSWKVIDVHKYTNITDYSAATHSIDGVVIKAGSRSYGASGSLAEDSKLETHYNGFLNKNIKIGYYFASNAITIEEAREEAEFVYMLINGKENDFPIYFLTEYATPERTGRADNLTLSVRTDIALAFCARANELGYRAGILVDDSFYNINLDTTRIMPLYPDSLSLWASRTSGSRPIYIPDYDGWRYTSTATLPGITNYVNETDFEKDVADWEVPPVEPEDINNYDIFIDQDTFIYTGSRITPTVTVSGLRLGLDYTVEYENNLNVGVGRAIVTGINAYTGVAIKSFTILPKDIADFTLVINPTSYEYTGSPIHPSYSISDLMLNVDFTEDVRNNTNIGTGELTLTGIGNYTGTVTGVFTITAKDISGMVGILSNYNYTYSGGENKPTISIVGLVGNVDFVESWYNNINAGIGHAVATGIGNYTGELDIIFNINPKSIMGYSIYLSQNRYTYSGDPKEPRATIYGLTENIDFTVAYRNNINAGTATVQLTGIGNYTEYNSTTFSILAKSITEVEVESIEDQLFTTESITPQVIIPGLIKDIDYRISYRNNINIGTAFVVIGGVGNYYGTFNYPFNIVPRPISETKLVYGTPSINHNFRIYDGTYALYCNDINIKLTENIDYQITDIVDMEVTVEATEEMPEYTYTYRRITIEGMGGFIEDYTFAINVLDEEIFDEDEPDIPDPPLPDDPELVDDLKFNFGDIDLGDESAEGDYDFSSLEDGVDEDNVAEGNYDFNILTTADMAINKLIENFGVNCDDIKDGTYDSLIGLEFDLDNTPIYANYSSTASSDSKSGLYFIYRPEVRSAKVRLTRLENAVEQPVRSTGWVRILDLAMLDMFDIGDEVIVNGRIYKYPNGTGSYIDMVNQVMYVTKIQKNDNTETYEYPYGLALILNGSVVGYGNNSCMEKATKSQIA